MNKALFASMREQMEPSEKARAALEEKLADTKRVSFPAKRYVAIAACLVVIAAAARVSGLVYNFFRDSREISIDPGPNCTVEITKPHSYVLLDGSAACWPENTTADTGGTGDEDQNMTPGEVTDNLLEAGFSQEDADAYLASGWQMTWAKWWKFYHLSEESGERTLDALLDFSQAEGLSVNTGELPTELPGGAYVGDEPDQSEAIMAYQNLMARFEQEYGPDSYPEWYGGAYIDEHAGLIVNIVEYLEPEDKQLFSQIWDWAGSDQVGFGSTQFSMNRLKRLQDDVMSVMAEAGMDAGCGINEESGQLELDLPYANDEILWKLARLDPEDTAILVRIGYYAADDTTASTGPAPSVSHNTVQPGGAPEPGKVENAIAFDD